MRNEAIRLSLPEQGWWGGILIDEMSIQQDLQIIKKGRDMCLVGNHDIGSLGNLADKISKEQTKLQLAKSVLQFIFLGHTGFRFPVAHFPVTTAQAHHLFFNFWEGVDLLDDYGFKVEYCSTDGAMSNRQFLKIHFLQDAFEKGFMSISPINPEKKMIFLMDVKHNLKKIRNGLLKSNGIDKSLEVAGSAVKWSHFQEAHDYNKSHLWKIHQKLSDEHFELTGPNKMRNKLAEDVLDSEMLNLFRELKKSKGSDCLQYNGTIALLEKTSKLVSFAQDMRPLTQFDQRIETLHELKNFFLTWDKSPPKEKLSSQCMEDIFSYLLGMISLHNQVSQRGYNVLVPARLNSDAVENFFCQQRGVRNGLNTNPNYASYSKSTNAIILTQTAISKKSNTSGQSRVTPYKFVKPTVSAKKKSLPR